MFLSRSVSPTRLNSPQLDSTQRTFLAQQEDAAEYELRRPLRVGDGIREAKRATPRAAKDLPRIDPEVLTHLGVRQGVGGVVGWWAGVGKCWASVGL